MLGNGRPLHALMQYAGDFDVVARDTVDDDVWIAGNNHFTGACTTTRATYEGHPVKPFDRG